MALDQVAASARASASAEELSRSHLYAVVGNSIHGIDEIAVVAAPAAGLRVALIEVTATPPSHRLHKDSLTSRRVVLLRWPPRQSPGKSHVEPVLTSVSRDAALWDMNEVLRQNMLLRSSTAAASSAVAQVAERGSKEAEKKTLRSFQDMLGDLKNGRIPPPSGVSYNQLKKEVGVLVKAAQELQADDVLVHSRIESLLQKRIRDKNLDGLLALQASWQQASPEAAIANDANDAADTAGGGEVDQAASEEAAAAGDAADDGSEGEGAQADPADQDEWAEGAVEAMQKASAQLERKSAEAREKRKKQKVGGLDFQLDLEGGTIELKLGDESALEDLASKLTKALLTGVVGGAEQSEKGVDSSSEDGASDDPEDKPKKSAEQQQAMDGVTSNVAASSGAADGAEDDESAESDEGSKTADLMARWRQALESRLKDSAAELGEGVDISDGSDQKFQVHFVKLDEAALDNAEGGLQGLMQQMLQQQQQQLNLGEEDVAHNFQTIDLQDLQGFQDLDLQGLNGIEGAEEGEMPMGQEGLAALVRAAKAALESGGESMFTADSFREGSAAEGDSEEETGESEDMTAL